jgi:putative flippase GtrA
MEDERSVSGRSVRFVLTGIIVNASLYVVFWMMLRAGVDYRIGVTLVYVLGMIWGYLQNHVWSWRSTEPIGGSFARYLLVYAIIYVVHISLVWLLVERLEVHPLIATLMLVVILIGPIFVVLDRFVFRSPPS